MVDVPVSLSALESPESMSRDGERKINITRDHVIDAFRIGSEPNASVLGRQSGEIYALLSAIQDEISMKIPTCKSIFDWDGSSWSG